jgi:hypothetical protein
VIALRVFLLRVRLALLHRWVRAEGRRLSIISADYSAAIADSTRRTARMQVEAGRIERELRTLRGGL